MNHAYVCAQDHTGCRFSQATTLWRIPVRGSWWSPVGILTRLRLFSINPGSHGINNFRTHHEICFSPGWFLKNQMCQVSMFSTCELTWHPTSNNLPPATGSHHRLDDSCKHEIEGRESIMKHWLTITQSSRVIIIMNHSLTIIIYQFIAHC